MRLIVGLLEPIGRHVGVNLCRREAGMPEEGLQAAEVRAVVEQMSGEAVTELMRTDGGGQTNLSEVFLHSTPDRMRAQTPA